MPTLSLQFLLFYVLLLSESGHLTVDPLHATDLFLYPLKTDNHRFSDVFRGCRKRTVALNGLMRDHFIGTNTLDF